MMIKNFSADQLSAFQAYTRLTVVAHAKGKKENNIPYKNNEVSFKDFQETLEQKKVVNESLSRKVDEWVKEHSKVQVRSHANNEMEARTMSYVEQAYNLGLVDLNGHLYNSKT